MKIRNVFIMLVLPVLAFSSQNRSAEPERFRNLITVEGSVLSEVPADFASFHFTVSGSGKDLSAAVAGVKRKVQKITDALFEIGLDERSLSTSRFYSGENFENKAFFTSNRDFIASIKVNVGVKDFDLLEPAVLLVSDSGVDQLSDIRFQLKGIEEIRAGAFEAAINKAKEKAQTIQNNLDIENIRVVSVEEVSNSGYPNPFNLVRSFGDDSQGPGSLIFAETIRVAVRVRVVYEITF